MYGATVEDIIRSVIEKLHDVPGIGTQTYGEDLFASKILEAVRYILNRYNIPWYRVFRTVTIDGVNGYATENISEITSALDILHVYKSGTDDKVMFAPSNFNPLRITGTRTKFLQPIPYVSGVEKCFHTWPKTATDSLDIVALARPLELEASTVVYFDVNLISDYVAGKVVESDGTNPGWAGNMIATFEESLATMFVNYQKNQADPRSGSGTWPTTYYTDEVDYA